MWNEKQVEAFWAYCAEREAIYQRRFVQKLPPPWSADPVFQQYSFCNNIRARDRGTIWAIENILTLPQPADRVFWTVFYRMFNNPDTMDAIKGPNTLNGFNREAVEQLLLKRQAEGKQIFRAAYMLAAATVNGPGAKIKMYLGILNNVYEWRAELANDLRFAGSMEEAWEVVKQIDYVGPFVGYQVVLDLDLDPYFHFPDNGWTYIGPGAVKGINRLLLNPPLKNQKAYLDAVNELTYSPDNVLKLDVHSVEFCCCEAEKYFRIKEGGKKTRRFVPKCP